MSSKVNLTSSQQAEREQQRTADQLEILLKIESGILRAESPKAIADVALELMETIIPCTASTVTLFQANHTETLILAGRNVGMMPGTIIPAAPVAVEARKRGEPLVIGDVTDLPVLSTGMQAVSSIGGKSLLSVPLLAQGELIGNLTLIDSQADEFSAEDIRVTQQIGNSVAIAIHNARLLEKERSARREAETLRSVAASMNASLEQDELLSLILQQLKRVLQYDSASILLFQDGSLTLMAQQGLVQPTETFIRELNALPKSLVRLTTEKKPQLVRDTQLDPDWIVFPGAEAVRCWLGIPLMVKDEFIGLLNMDSTQPRSYQASDAAIALAFANHAAVAIENANLYQQSLQYTEQLETRVIERTQELEALYEVTDIISQDRELGNTMAKVVSVISTVLDCETVTIQVLADGGRKLSLLSYKGLSAPMVEYMQEMSVNQLPIIQEIFDRGEAVYHIIDAADGDLLDVPLQQLVTFGVGAPIRVKEKDFGFLGIASKRKEPPNREDLALLLSIADHVGVAIENAQLRQQAKQLAVLEERERLARDLHDSATQSLFTLTLFAAAAREHLSSRELESVNRQLVDLEATAVQTHKEMRLLLYELRPALLEEGLEKALRQRMQMVEFHSGIRGDIVTNLAAELPMSIEVVLFQVANEALNNALKHSDADKVKITINVDKSEVTMTIEDNGKGFSREDATFSAGMGIENMNKRVQDLGGTFHYENKPHRGTIIVVNIPLTTEDNGAHIETEDGR